MEMRKANSTNNKQSYSPEYVCFTKLHLIQKFFKSTLNVSMSHCISHCSDGYFNKY